MAYYLLLKPLSWLYGLLWALRYAWLQGQARKVEGAWVLSVGNVSVGGTGKTPLVIELCRRLKRRGKVCVISRGYGGASAPSNTLLVSRGQGPLAPAELCGDEPWLIAAKTRGVLVMVDPDRNRAAALAVQEFGAKVLVLDDGFQQRLKIKRDLDLVLVDPPGTAGAAELLPAGRLREPQRVAEAATAVVLHPGQKTAHRGPQRLTVERKPGKLRTLGGRASAGLRGRRVVALSGIARPENFEDSLRRLGARQVVPARFADHHAFSVRDVEAVMEMARQAKASFVVTTEKDEARLLNIKQAKNFKVLEMRLNLSPEKAWQRLLMGKS